MAGEVLNGWTAPRLDRLEEKVDKLAGAIESMRDEEMREMREELVDARNQARIAKAQSRTTFHSFAAPIVAAVVTVLLLVAFNAAHL